MSQSQTARFKGTWKALFICPNTKIIRDLTPLLSRHLPTFAAHEVNAYPTRHQVSDLLAVHAPNLCFLEAGIDLEPALAVIPELLKINPRLPIVVILPGNDSNQILRCLRQGASDFLLQPFTAEQVEAAMVKISRPQPNRAAPGKVYCVMPAKGGCGASTIASSLAYQWKRLGPQRILLADLDPLAGTLSFLLKIKSSYSFVDVLQRSSEIDAGLWKQLITSRQGVDVLIAPEVMVEGLSDLTD